MNKVQKNRMLKLAENLKTVEAKRFDMYQWFQSTCVEEDEAGAEQCDHAPTFIEGWCGTTACSLGYACVFMPQLFKKNGNDVKYVGAKPAHASCVDDDDDGFVAAQEGFGISYFAAKCLFGFAGKWGRHVNKITRHVNKITPKMVALQLEMYVNDPHRWLAEQDPND